MKSKTSSPTAEPRLRVGLKDVSREAFSNAVQARLGANPKARVGRPRVETPKVSTTIRFDADVLEAMKSTGPGWQTRINDIVRAYVLEFRRD